MGAQPDVTPFNYNFNHYNSLPLFGGWMKVCSGAVDVNAKVAKDINFKSALNYINLNTE